MILSNRFSRYLTMETIDRNMCLPLPSSITNQISTCKNSEKYVTNLLQNLLPSSDTKDISDELRKNFLFGKHRTKQRHKAKRRGKLLTNKKRLQLGLRKVGCRDEMQYNDLLPLNELWVKYMENMLGSSFFSSKLVDPLDSNWENINQQLMKADFHGAEVLVMRSKCASLIGHGGIVIQDTKNVFRVCCKDNIVRTIPKDVVLFKVFLRQIELQIFGKELSVKPAERTVKKFKAVRTFTL